MSYGKWLLDQRRRAKKKGRQREERWRRIDASHEINLYKVGTEEVLAIRKVWTKSVVATVNLPAGTVSNYPYGQLRKVVMAIVKKQAGHNGQEPLTARVYTPWIKDHMRLWEYLTEAVYSDGSPRLTSTLTVMVGDVSGLKMVLNDRAESLSLWATGADIPECLDTLEILLGDDNPPWKRDKRLTLKPGKTK